jgi:hypothetical protein
LRLHRLAPAQRQHRSGGSGHKRRAARTVRERLKCTLKFALKFALKCALKCALRSVLRFFSHDALLGSSAPCLDGFDDLDDLDDLYKFKIRLNPVT